MWCHPGWDLGEPHPTWCALVSSMRCWKCRRAPTHCTAASRSCSRGHSLGSRISQQNFSRDHWLPPPHQKTNKQKTIVSLVLWLVGAVWWACTRPFHSPGTALAGRGRTWKAAWRTEVERAGLALSKKYIKVYDIALAFSSQLIGLSVSNGKDQLVVFHTKDNKDLVVCLFSKEPSNDNRIGELVGVLTSHFKRSVLFGLCWKLSLACQIRNLLWSHFDVSLEFYLCYFAVLLGCQSIIFPCYFWDILFNCHTLLAPSSFPICAY